MRFAISIPQFFAADAFDPAAFRGYLTRAERLGFESAWTQEQILGAMPTLDPITTLTYAAACTESIRLGCAVLVTPLYSPIHLAKSLSSLDQLSRGRLEVGVGSGGRPRMFSAFAVDPERVAARFIEGLRLMQACWTEDQITFDGDFWHLDNAAMEPKPFQKPYPPLWFGAHRRVALRRAVQLGDGFFGAGSATTARFAEQVRIVREELARSGRDPATFQIAKRVYVGVDDDADRVRQRVATALDQIYGYHDLAGRLAPVAVAGTPEDCVRGLRDVVAAGAQLILLNVLFDDAEQMERLAAEVVPHLA